MAASVKLQSTTPILRIFDEQRAKQFYLQFLSFQLDWEHRFEDDLPLYMQISRGACMLHLSEHHGDCCPGSALRIETENIRQLHADLLAQRYKFARPGLEETPWNTVELRVTDPFGNRLQFFESLPE